MQTPYYDKLQARQDDRQALIDKQLEKLQQVPNTWIYQSPGEVERLCKEYVADLIERGEMVEEEEKEELVPYVEGN